MVLEKAQSGNRIFQFNDPIEFKLGPIENGETSISSIFFPLPILCFFDRQEILETIGNELAYLWDYFAHEKDEKLTQDAKELKALLLDKVICVDLTDYIKAQRNETKQFSQKPVKKN